MKKNQFKVGKKMLGLYSCIISITQSLVISPVYCQILEVFDFCYHTEESETFKNAMMIHFFAIQ